MNRSLLLSLILPFSLLSQNNFKKKANVLFLGNSYTYVNNLPLLIYNIARANGDTMSYDSNTIGGYSLGNHMFNTTSISKINAENWDYVVLQAQSQEPSFPDQQVMSQTYRYAIKLDSVVKANYNCSNTVFYETWGRKFGDQGNCPNFPPLCTYTGMQDRLKKWYGIFADSTDGIMAPAGEAWRASIAANASLELYDPDQSHPSLAGSYLTACVFYETLFQRSVLSNTYNPGLAANTLTFLQQTAHTVLRDSLKVWNIGINLPWADFTYTATTPGTYQFSGSSATLTNTWYFGDGTNSQAVAPTHAYGATGNYTVSHVVKNGCKKDSVVKVISVTGGTPTGISENKEALTVSVYPNPCRDLLYFAEARGFENSGALLEISDVSGRVLRADGFKSPLSVSDLLPGVYFVKITDNLGSQYSRFIKNE